jgi:hypothetical protein
MGPIEIIFCWQAVLCALVASVVAQAAKTLIDIRAEAAVRRLPVAVQDRLRRSVQPGRPMRLGKLRRKQSRLMTQVVVPGLAIVAGMAFAVLVPFVPEQLSGWFDSHEMAWWQELSGRAAWGAVCGQFANYAYDRVRNLVRHQGAAE